MRLRAKERERLLQRALTANENRIDEDFAPDRMRARFPADWHDICDTPVPKKKRITIRLDADVVQFFQAMGAGYQTRVNRVLRSFMLARLARLVDGPESRPATGAKPFDFDRIRAELLAKLEAERAARGEAGE